MQDEGQLMLARLNFWKNLFPWRFVFYQLGTFDGAYRMEQREIAIDCGQGKLSRNQVYDSMHALMERLQGNMLQIESLHLGYIYTEWFCAEGRKGQRELVTKDASSHHGELVLDADINDFDRSGICKCQGADYCQNCWKTCMQLATGKFLKAFFQRWNIQRYFFVFSGRRGMHVWIVEPEYVRMEHWRRAKFMDLLCSHSFELFTQSTGLDAKRYFPRFDRPVSEDKNHMHKVPLGLHAATSNFCNVIEDPETFFPGRDAIHVTNALLLTPELINQNVNFIKRKMTL